MLDEIKMVVFSFSAAGNHVWYQLGVSKYLTSSKLPFTIDRIHCSSAGIFSGVCVLANITPDINQILELAQQQRDLSAFELMNSRTAAMIILRGYLEAIPNVLDLINGKLFVHTTDVSLMFPFIKEKIISQFNSIDDIITAAMCTSCIPGVDSWFPELVAGNRYIDGGFCNYHPCETKDTIVVSTFPKFQPWTIAWKKSAFEIYRYYNPKTQILSMTSEEIREMYEAGMEDARKFIANQSFVPGNVQNA